ncbi:MAG: bifunctional nuclease family protein [Candidatus Ratteibacteria bacterium]|jgi:bifunctional DNase/RNase
MMKVEVEGVVLNLQTSASIVILKDERGYVLPIVIGVFETHSIYMVLQKEKSVRPFPYELTHTLVRALRARILRLEIHSLRKGIYFASLLLQQGNNPELRIDCRPSDGIAIALYAGAPLYVAKKLLVSPDRISIEEGELFFTDTFEQPIGKAEANAFKRRLAQLSAKEFWKELKRK